MEKKILAAASFYKQKYFLNPEFNQLPNEILEDIHIHAVILAEKIHGVFLMGFDEDGEIFLETQGDEHDLSYDDIGAGLEVSRFLRSERDLVKSLQLWYSIFVHQENEGSE